MAAGAAELGGLLARRSRSGDDPPSHRAGPGRGTRRPRDVCRSIPRSVLDPHERSSGLLAWIYYHPVKCTGKKEVKKMNNNDDYLFTVELDDSQLGESSGGSSWACGILASITQCFGDTVLWGSCRLGTRACC